MADYEADNPWWTGYPHGRPKTARKTVASTFVEKVETRLCNSMSSWCAPARIPLLHVRSVSTRTWSEGVGVGFVGRRAVRR